MHTRALPETPPKRQYGPTSSGDEPCRNRSSLSSLSSELARIEGLAVAGHCDANHALDAVVHALASLEQVSGVEVALAVGGEFVSVVSSGVERLVGTSDHLQVYVHCITSGRLVRCEDTSTDPRAHGIPFSSMIVTPLSARGDLIGVLAVYSSDPDVFGHDHIVPLGTAAVICSVLAPEVLETKIRLTPSPQSLPGSAASFEGVAPVAKLDGTHQYDTLSPEPELLTQRDSPPETGADATLGVAADGNIRNLTSRVDSGTKDRDSAQHLAREEAIRSVLLNKPGKRFREIPSQPSMVDAAISLLRSPFGIAVLLLLLSGFVFGSMQMLRRSAAVASNSPTAAATATRSGTVTKLLGAPRPVRGNAADAQITRGRLIQDGLPAYPPDALGRAVQGDVTAILLVSERGAVEDVRVTGGNTLLSNNVLSSLSHWRFSPFEVNGRAIAVEVPVMMGFHINVETNSASK